MIITKEQLQQIAPRAKNADSIVETLNKWAPKFDIDTPLRMAHFIAQCAHECAEFNILTEIASGWAYEGNKKLGNVKKGDGPRYKGRGWLQLTGRRNYQAYADSPNCIGDLMSHPEWLSRYPGAAKSAMWYWQSRNLNYWADRDNVMAVTKKINGGYNGLAQRKKYLARAKEALL